MIALTGHDIARYRVTTEVRIAKMSYYKSIDIKSFWKGYKAASKENVAYRCWWMTIEEAHTDVQKADFLNNSFST